MGHIQGTACGTGYGLSNGQSMDYFMDWLWTCLWMDFRVDFLWTDGCMDGLMDIPQPGIPPMCQKSKVDMNFFLWGVHSYGLFMDYVVDCLWTGLWTVFS